jgi:hypothetical protein
MFTYLGPNFEASINLGKHDHAYNDGESRAVLVFIQSPTAKSQGLMELHSGVSHILKFGTIEGQ